MRVILDKKIPLIEQEIDALSLELQQVLEKYQCAHKDIVRFRLGLENALLNWLEAGLREKILKVTVLKKYRKCELRLSLEGRAVDPLQAYSNFSTDKYLQSFLATTSNGMQYQYLDGNNILRWNIIVQTSHDMTYLCAAVILGLASGYLVTGLVPEAAETISLELVTPVYSTLLGVLNAFIAPVIFLSLLMGIVNVGDPVRMRYLGKKVLLEIFGSLMFMSLLIGGICWLWMPLTASHRTGLLTLTTKLSSMFLNFVPTNLIVPFSSGNLMQIVVLAIIFGFAIIYIREAVDDVVALLASLNTIMNSILNIVISGMPLLIYFGMFQLALTQNEGIFSLIFMTMVFNMVLRLLLEVLLTGYLGFKLKRNPLPVVKKMLPPVLVAGIANSGAAAYTDKVNACEKQLGIQSNFVNFFLPLAQMLFKPGALVSIFAVSLIFMDFYKLPMDTFTIAILTMCAFVLPMTMPPIPGGSLASFSLLFSYFQIPQTGLALCLAIVVLNGFFSTALNTYGNMVLAVTAAHSLKLTDEKVFLREK